MTDLPHRCGDTCVCGIHDTPFFYSPATGEHACQDPTCIWASGYEATLLQARKWESDAWTEAGLLDGIPRCLMFPDRGPCCGRVNADGTMTGTCPTPS